MSPRRRIVALLVVAVAFVLSALYARGVSLDSGVQGYLPDDVPAVKEWRESLARFGAFDSWLVGLEEPGPGLSIEGLRHVDAVTRSLEALKASGVLSVRSVTNVETVREGEGGAVESGPLVTALPGNPSALDATKRSIAGNPAVLGALVSRDLKGYTLVVRADPRKDASALARLIEQTVEAKRGPLRAHYLGAPFFAAAPVKGLVAHLRFIVPAFVLLFVGIFIAGKRSAARAILVVGAAAASLVFWVAATRLLGRSLSPASGPEALAWFACAGVILAAIGESPASGQAPRWPSAVRTAVCLAAVVAGGALSLRARLLCTPQDMFSPGDEVGETLAFFDDRFGGSDFLQVDYKGDLTDPAAAARLLRLSDLIEGSSGVSDVRSVAQVLAFVNHGFGDAFRIPSSQTALSNVWFFLEGNSDVRNLVSDRRDEALVQVRIPSHPDQGVDALTSAVNAAIVASAGQGAPATGARLEAIARASGVALDPARVQAVTDAATREAPSAEEAVVRERVTARLRKVLASPDSPYQPSSAEWETIAGVVAGGPRKRRSRLDAATASIKGLGAGGMAAKLVDMLVQQEHDLRVAVRSELLAARLLPEGTTPAEQLRLRAEGALADLVDPQKDAGRARVTVSGLRVVAPAIAARSLSHLWRMLALILGVGCLLVPLLGRAAGASRVLVAATATAVTFLGCRAVGVELDSESATIYVLPAILGLVAPVERRGPRSFLLALGAAMLVLLVTGVAPVTRLATATAVGLGSTALVAWFVRGSGGKPDAYGQSTAANVPST